MAYKNGRELIAEGAESVEDMYIEAKAEPERAPPEGLVADPT